MPTSKYPNDQNYEKNCPKTGKNEGKKEHFRLYQC